RLFTAMTGEFSVGPYPSKTRSPAAEKILISLSWQAAPPVMIDFTFPPRASLHLLKTSLFASFSCRSYHAPGDLLLSYLFPRSTAQKNSFLLTPRRAAPFDMILSYTFSSRRG